MKAVGVAPKMQSSSSSAADYVLSIVVVRWSTFYLPIRMSRYRLMLVVGAKILHNTTVLRNAHRIIRPHNVPDAPTFRELMENDGLRLRAELEYATQACTAQLRQSLLGE